MSSAKMNQNQDFLFQPEPKLAGNKEKIHSELGSKAISLSIYFIEAILFQMLWSIQGLSSSKF